MKASLLIAVYNAEPWLSECLDSLLAQTHTHWEALCVDDASTDHSPNILRQYAARDKRIKPFFLPENHGQAHARNVALAQATGEVIAMLDADDKFAPDTLALALQALQQHPQADIALLRLMLWQPDGSVEPWKANVPHTLPTNCTGAQAFLLSINWQIHGLYVARADLARRIPYDESVRLYADDNTTRLHYLHARRVVECQGEYFYRQHTQSATHARSPQRFLFLEANLSLKQQLDTRAQAGTPTDDPQFWQQALQLLETHRLQNLVAHYRLFQHHQQAFSPTEQAAIRALLQRIRATIEYHRLTRTLKAHPRYFPWPTYALFAAAQSVCNRLHILLKR